MEAYGKSKVLAKFEARSDLHEYGPNALLLFALQLRWGITDIEGVAAVALTDSSNDKKCDLVYVDRANGRVVVGQGYFSEKADLTAAPSNKASDLNTAVTWLLSGPLEAYPKSCSLQQRRSETQSITTKSVNFISGMCITPLSRRTSNRS